MAVLFACSFEAGRTSFYIEGGWAIGGDHAGVGSSRVHVDPNGVGGDYALDLGGVTYVAIPTQDPAQAETVHFAWQPRAAGSPVQQIWEFTRNAGRTFIVRINTSGYIDLIRLDGPIFAGTIVASSATPIVLGTPHWFAIRLVAATSGGEVEVYVDGALVVSYTGNTQGHATLDGWDRFAPAGVDVVGSDCTIDDVIVTDSVTGVLAEHYAKAQRPASVVSGVLVGTPTTGSGRWANVSEDPASTSEYNTASSSGDEDRYGLTPIGTTPDSILCAVVWVEGARSGGLTQIEALLSSGGTDAYSAAPYVLPGSGHGVHSLLLEDDPDTAAAWTPAGLDAAVVGARFTT